MDIFRVVRLTVFAVAMIASTAYLILSMFSLVVGATISSANTAPEGSYHELELDGGDSIFNWDFKSKNKSISNVDWGMRFVFAGTVVTQEYVKSKLDGDGNDPAISPELTSTWATEKYAWIHDGPEQTGSAWGSDDGLKTNPGCTWNWGHIRVYAKSGGDHNHNSLWGNYVVASSHVDYEYEPTCRNKYRSYESDEVDWINRINGSPLTGSPYYWNTDETFNFRNGSGGAIVNLVDTTHKYHSDGWGTVVRVRTHTGGSTDEEDK